MSRLVVVLVLSSACSFTGRSGAQDDAAGDTDAPWLDDGAPPIDARIDAPGIADAQPDAMLPPPDAECELFSIDLCSEGVPDGPTILAGLLDTDLDARCRTHPQPGGADACLIYAQGVTVADTGVIVTGSRPLVIASTIGIQVTGTLDVSSQHTGQVGAAANDGFCAAARLPEDDAGGAAGGAGGSFGGTGGDGGTGDTDDSIGGDGTALGGLGGPTAGFAGFARGGCPGSTGGDEGIAGGQGGAGGSSGGAVWLAAAGVVRVTAAGAIRATGAGASGGQVQSGGGGGGSGGMVVIEAGSIIITGGISANGGGGGEGGTRIAGTPVTGNRGADGMMGASPAPGGSGAPGSAGDGGAGSAGAALDGIAGMSTIVGAGGGGGAAGIIHLVGPVSGTGVISPPPS